MDINDRKPKQSTVEAVERLVGPLERYRFVREWNKPEGERTGFAMRVEDALRDARYLMNKARGISP